MFFQMMEYSKSALWVKIYNAFAHEAINSEQQARNLGENIAHKIYDKTGLVDFDRYVIRVSDYGTEWVIYYSIPPKPPEEDDNGFLKASVEYLDGLASQGV